MHDINLEKKVKISNKKSSWQAAYFLMWTRQLADLDATCQGC